MPKPDYATTSDYDIKNREKLGIPLSRKQAKAKKQREANPPSAKGYSRKHSQPVEILTDSTGHTIIVPKGTADKLTAK